MDIAQCYWRLTDPGLVGLAEAHYKQLERTNQIFMFWLNQHGFSQVIWRERRPHGYVPKDGRWIRKPPQHWMHARDFNNQNEPPFLIPSLRTRAGRKCQAFLEREFTMATPKALYLAVGVPETVPMPHPIISDMRIHAVNQFCKMGEHFYLVTPISGPEPSPLLADPLSSDEFFTIFHTEGDCCFRL